MSPESIKRIVPFALIAIRENWGVAGIGGRGKTSLTLPVRLAVALRGETVNNSARLSLEKGLRPRSAVLFSKSAIACSSFGVTAPTAGTAWSALGKWPRNSTSESSVIIYVEKHRGEVQTFAVAS